mmetsp:Transcript_5864/g.8208  ORF Transcript_5864/g.8208 Transcript_5864/m.8208 type:complete len:271 (+) Transcript_5864:53-865(+)
MLARGKFLSKPKHQYKAVVFGGNSAVGRGLVKELASSSSCVKITSIDYKPSNIHSEIDASLREKISHHVISSDNFEKETQKLVSGNTVAFWAAQTESAQQTDLNKYEVEHLSKFAELCKEAGVHHFSMLSTMDADSHASNPVQHLKGVAENQVESVKFDRLSLFKPFIISQPGHTSSSLESVLHFAYPTVGWLLPQRYHPTAIPTLSKAMRFNVEIGALGTVERYEHQDFLDIIDQTTPAKRSFIPSGLSKYFGPVVLIGVSSAWLNLVQ